MASLARHRCRVYEQQPSEQKKNTHSENIVRNETERRAVKHITQCNCG